MRFAGKQNVRKFCAQLIYAVLNPHSIFAFFEQPMDIRVPKP